MKNKIIAINAIIQKHFIAIMAVIALMFASGMAGAYAVYAPWHESLVSACNKGAASINQDVVASQEWLADGPEQVIDQTARLGTKIEMLNNICSKTFSKKVAAQMEAARKKFS